VCAASFADGAAVTLSAHPDSAWMFSGWGGNCSGRGDCTVVISADSNVTAAFAASPPDECDGLRPSAPGAASGRHSMKGVATCLAGVGDGFGTMAFAMLDTFNISNSSVHFVSPSADLLASYGSMHAAFTGQLAGFEAIVWSRDGRSSLLRAWDSKGSVVAETATQPDGNVLIAEDPLGGVVVWRMAGPGGHALESYDEALHLRWRVITPGDRSPGAFAVDRKGRTLALFGADFRTAPNAIDGVWVDHDGNASAVFRALGQQKDAAHNMAFMLTQRVGSGLFLGTPSEWIGQFDSLSTTMADPPEWLKARPGTMLHMVHGGTGYAVLPPWSPDCVRTVEVVAPSGTSCGSATFAAVSDSCRFPQATIGYDGTLMLGFSETYDQCGAGGTCTCTWQWWAGFFR
jgi:hypothetical protein